MHSANSISDSKQYYITEIPVNSRETYELYERLNDTCLNKEYDLSKSWMLQKSISIRNHLFEQEFDDKNKEIDENNSYPEYSAVRYGFLATIKEKMIEKVASEGLEIKMCPYNYLGYNIAGVHISQNADVCLTEAKAKIVEGDELILILFQYMLGKRKIVPMHDPKVLLAPTPKFDSHICEERPDPKEKESAQYIKSLVYLYEFANGNLDPIIRPRHCCPVAALIFKNIPLYESLDLTGTEPINSYSTYTSPLSLLKPVSQHSQPTFWGRQKIEGDARKLILDKEKEYEIEKPTAIDETWRSISYGQQYINDGSRDLMYSVPKNRTGETMLLKSIERERSPERNVKWNESRGTNKSGRGASHGSTKAWFK